MRLSVKIVVFLLYKYKVWFYYNKIVLKKGEEKSKEVIVVYWVYFFNYIYLGNEVICLIVFNDVLFGLFVICKLRRGM